MNRYKIWLRHFILIFIYFNSYAQKQDFKNQAVELKQNTRIFSVDSVSNASSSILEVQSKNQGFKFPLLTTEQRQNIPNPDLGLIVFDTDFKKLFIFDGVLWQGLEFTQTNKTYSSEIYAPQNSAIGGVTSMHDNFAFVLHTNEIHYYIKNNVGAWIDSQVIKPTVLESGESFCRTIFYRNDTLICGTLKNVYVFVKNVNGIYVQNSKISRPVNDTNYFGSTIYLWQGHIVVTSSSSLVSAGPFLNTVYVYKKNNSVWIISQTFTHPYDVHFGFTIVLENGYLFLGTAGWGGVDPTRAISRIHVYKLQNGQFDFFQYIVENGEDFLGDDVFFSNNKLYAKVRQSETLFGIGVYEFENGQWVRKDFINTEIQEAMRFRVNNDRVMVSYRQKTIGDFQNNGEVVFFKKQNNQWVETNRIVPLELGYNVFFGNIISFFNNDYIISGYTSRQNKNYISFGRIVE